MRVSQHVGSASGQASFAALRDAVCRGREPPPGALYDRLGPRLLTVSGMLICVGALALLFAVPNSARIGFRKRLRSYRQSPSVRGDEVGALMTMVMGTPPELAQRAREFLKPSPE